MRQRPGSVARWAARTGRTAVAAVWCYEGLWARNAALLAVGWLLAGRSGDG
jgi:hypothetical protein